MTSNNTFLDNNRIERILFYLMCVLCATPLLFSHYLPMVDIPQHAAQVNTLKQLLWSTDFPYHDYFQINWFRPYWGAYLPLILLSSFMPMYLAIKLFLAVLIISIPLAISRLRAHFNAPPILDWLALPIAYGFAFQWGLVTFLLGVPVVILYLLQVFRYTENPKRRTAWLLAIGSFGLLAIHLLIAALALGMSATYLFSGKDTLRKKMSLLMPLLAWVPLAIIWLVLRVLAGGHASHEGPWGLGWLRIMEFISTSVAEPASLRAIAIGTLVYALPFLLGFRLTNDKRRLAMFFMLCLWMLLGPNFFIGNFLTTQRFSIFGIPFFIILFEPKQDLAPHHKRWRLLAYGLPLLLLAHHCLRFSIFDLETRGYREIAAYMQPKQRVLSLIMDNHSYSYGGPQHLHLPSWYQGESDGLTDVSFAMYPLQAAYRPDAPALWEYGFEWKPQRFDWFKHQGWLYDYFIVRHPQNLGAYLFRSTSCPVTLVANHEQWWLYKNDKSRCIHSGQ